MRIIGGRLRGKRIAPPAGYQARPTTDFAREGLFDVLDHEYELEGMQVLDLFSGTGAVAFEFASRGAAAVYAVERVREHAAFIRREAAALGLPQIRLVQGDVFAFLPRCREKFDLIFADPPYRIESLAALPDAVLSRGLLHPERYFILEHPETYAFTSHPSFVKEKRYGRVHFSFFQS